MSLADVAKPETNPFFDPNFTEERAALQERLNVYLECVVSSASPHTFSRG
jgi:hypothetical protein